MTNFAALRRHGKPFEHWIADGFVDADTVREINAQWPAADTPGFGVESGVAAALKGALLFPRRLPLPAQQLAVSHFEPAARTQLSALVGIDLLPDPWLHEGPERPQLGGGLHEIHPGGRLGIHVDFEKHPSGLRRVANLLIYLNERWQPEWGGALELHRERPGSAMTACSSAIDPIGGRAVFFLTKPESWHGHPHPLQCPAGVTRRSLALYYYAADTGAPARPKTVYRTKG